MREIKNVYHSQAERESALALLHAYQEESSQILTSYCALEKVIQQRYQHGEITFEEYITARAPFLEQYKTKERELYKEYLKGVSDIGYDLSAE